MRKMLRIVLGLIVVAGLGAAAYIYTMPEAPAIALPPLPPLAGAK